MEEAGVHVVYGLVGLKTHCKMMMIVRRDEDRIRLYTHLGTGNYNSTTARFLHGPEPAHHRAGTHRGGRRSFSTILPDLSEYRRRQEVVGRAVRTAPALPGIDRPANATRRALAAKGGRIIVKLNSLVDEKDHRGVVRAHPTAGVQIDLIVRGVCSLRPGTAGHQRKHPRAVSIIGRFLEHSRIYNFGNGGKSLVYLGSADWMQSKFRPSRGGRVSPWKTKYSRRARIDG